MVWCSIPGKLWYDAALHSPACKNGDRSTTSVTQLGEGPLQVRLEGEGHDNDITVKKSGVE